MFLFTKPEADMSHKNGFVLRTFEDTVAIGIATFFNRINAFPPLNVHRFHVLVADLPCSGLGVLRKKTDIRYKMSRGQQEELEELQRRILDTVCSYVKKDGIMVYSTCTINPGENQENVAWFLGKHPEFELLDMEQI